MQSPKLSLIIKQMKCKDSYLYFPEQLIYIWLSLFQTSKDQDF